MLTQKDDETDRHHNNLQIQDQDSSFVVLWKETKGVSSTNY